jgi:hypothetical protein
MTKDAAATKTSRGPFPLCVDAPSLVTSRGLTPLEKNDFSGFDPIRQIELASIRRFVGQNRELLRGRVLDFGAGKPGTCRNPQPYRDLVDPSAEYVPVDIGDPWFPGGFNTVLCTQVVQYIFWPLTTLRELHNNLVDGGHLILTYPTSWDEVEAMDLWRFTKAGMERLLFQAGFEIVKHERRAEVVLGSFRFPIGYGCIARKI